MLITKQQFSINGRKFVKVYIGQLTCYLKLTCLNNKHEFDKLGNCITCANEKEQLKINNFEEYRKNYYCKNCGEREKYKDRGICIKCLTKMNNEKLIPLRKERKEKGLCIICGEKRESNATYCEKHRIKLLKSIKEKHKNNPELRKIKDKEFRKKNKEKGLCSEGHEKINGFCPICSKYKKDRYERLKNDHMCIYCGRNETFYDPRYKRWMSACAACLEARQEDKLCKAK